MFDPRVDPRFVATEDDSVRVSVHQVVKDVAGAVLFDQLVQHIFRLQNGIVVRFDIADAPADWSFTPD